MQEIKTIVKRVQGSSGTRIFAGYIFEDYLAQLLTQQRAYIFDKMRRQDPAIGQLINIMNNVLSSLTHEIKVKPEYMDIPEAIKQQEFITKVLFYNMNRSFDEVLKDIHTQNIYGYSLFEGLWKNEITDAFGAVTVLKDMLWRSPKTIWEFHIDEKESLDYVVQRAYGDSQKDDVKMPGENTFIFTLEKEGINFEGISPLRRVYGPWQIKQELLNLLIIGSDKFSVPTVMFRSALAGQDDGITKKMEEAIIEYQGGNGSFLIFPSQFEPIFPKFDFKPEEIIKAIELCNNEMIKESSATFLEMQKGGSYALGSAMIQFFHNAIDSKSKLIAAPFNTRIIPALIRMNRPTEPCMVELMFSAAGQSVSKDYAESLSKLTQQNMITPDDTLESFLRKNMNLPEQDTETIRMTPQQQKMQQEADSGANNGDDGPDEPDDDDDPNFSTKKKEFSQTYQRAPVQMKKAKRSLMLVVDRVVNTESEKIIEILKSHFRKSKSESEKLNIPDLAINRGRIVDQVWPILRSVYDDASVNIKRELASIEKRRGLKEGYSTPFAAKPGKIYAKKDAELLAKALGEEIEDTLGGSYLSLAADAKDFRELETKLVKAGNEIKKKSKITAGFGLAASEVVNRSRADVFKSIEKRIESYTYYNDAPVTPLCSYLNGKTMKPSNLKTPPFHWGCDGYIVPNLVQWKNNPSIDKIQITGKMRKGMKFLQ